MQSPRSMSFRMIVGLALFLGVASAAWFIAGGPGVAHAGPPLNKVEDASEFSLKWAIGGNVAADLGVSKTVVVTPPDGSPILGRYPSALPSDSPTGPIRGGSKDPVPLAALPKETPTGRNRVSFNVKFPSPQGRLAEQLVLLDNGTVGPPDPDKLKRADELLNSCLGPRLVSTAKEGTQYLDRTGLVKKDGGSPADPRDPRATWAPADVYSRGVSGYASDAHVVDFGGNRSEFGVKCANASLIGLMETLMDTRRYDMCSVAKTGLAMDVGSGGTGRGGTPVAGGIWDLSDAHPSLSNYRLSLDLDSAEGSVWSEWSARDIEGLLGRLYSAEFERSLAADPSLLTASEERLMHIAQRSFAHALETAPDDVRKFIREAKVFDVDFLEITPKAPGIRLVPRTGGFSKALSRLRGGGRLLGAAFLPFMVNDLTSPTAVPPYTVDPIYCVPRGNVDFSSPMLTSGPTERRFTTMEGSDPGGDTTGDGGSGGIATGGTGGGSGSAPPLTDEQSDFMSTGRATPCLSPELAVRPGESIEIDPRELCEFSSRQAGGGPFRWEYVEHEAAGQTQHADPDPRTLELDSFYGKASSTLREGGDSGNGFDHLLTYRTDSAAHGNVEGQTDVIAIRVLNAHDEEVGRSDVLIDINAAPACSQGIYKAAQAGAGLGKDAFKGSGAFLEDADSPYAIGTEWNRSITIPARDLCIDLDGEKLTPHIEEVSGGRGSVLDVDLSPPKEGEKDDDKAPEVDRTRLQKAIAFRATGYGTTEGSIKLYVEDSSGMRSPSFTVRFSVRPTEPDCGAVLSRGVLDGESLTVRASDWCWENGRGSDAEIVEVPGDGKLFPDQDAFKTDPKNGTLTSKDGNLVYTPDGGVVKEDSFFVMAKDHIGSGDAVRYSRPFLVMVHPRVPPVCSAENLQNYDGLDAGFLRDHSGMPRRTDDGAYLVEAGREIPIQAKPLCVGDNPEEGLTLRVTKGALPKPAGEEDATPLKPENGAFDQADQIVFTAVSPGEKELGVRAIDGNGLVSESTPLRLKVVPATTMRCEDVTKHASPMDSPVTAEVPCVDLASGEPASDIDVIVNPVDHGRVEVEKTAGGSPRLRYFPTNEDRGADVRLRYRAQTPDGAKVSDMATVTLHIPLDYGEEG